MHLVDDLAAGGTKNLRHTPRGLVTLKFGGLFILFGLMLYVPVNSYGHVWAVSSPNHTYFLGKLSTSCTYFRLLTYYFISVHVSV